MVFSFSDRKKVGTMPNSSRSDDSPTPRQIEVLVVQSNPSDTLLTVEAFHAAGVDNWSQLRHGRRRCPQLCSSEGKYARAPVPDVIFLDLSQPRVLSRRS